MTDGQARELQQNPAPVLREVEAEADVDLLVNGRAVARIVPLDSPAWVTGDRAERIYDTEVDSDWENDLRTADEGDVADDPGPYLP